MTNAELDKEIALLRYQAICARKIADSLDARADELRGLRAQQSTEELKFELADNKTR